MKRDIRHGLENVKLVPEQKFSVTTSLLSPKDLFANVYADITGPLEESNGYSYLLVVIDCFIRLMHAIPIIGITAEKFVDAFI